MGTLKGKKTYVVATLAVIGAVAAYLTGEADAAQAIQTSLTAILAATVRNGIG